MNMQTYNENHKLYQEPLGLRVLKEFVVRCKDCNTPLANILLTETNEDRLSRNQKAQKSKYQVVNCSKCEDGSSFETEVFEGSTSIANAREGYTLEEEDTDILDGGVILSTVRVRKENV